MTRHKTINRGQISYAVADERLTVVGLLLVVCCNGQILFIKHINSQFNTIINHIFGHRTTVASPHVVICPAGQTCGGNIVGVTDTQVLVFRIFSRNGVTIHIQEVDGELGGLEVCVLKHQHIVALAGGKRQILHIMQRIVVILDISTVPIALHPGLVRRHSELGNGDCGSWDSCNHLVSMQLHVVIRSQHILHRITGGFTTSGVVEGNLIGSV